MQPNPSSRGPASCHGPRGRLGNFFCCCFGRSSSSIESSHSPRKHGVWKLGSCLLYIFGCSFVSSIQHTCKTPNSIIHCVHLLPKKTAYQPMFTVSSSLLWWFGIPTNPNQLLLGDPLQESKPLTQNSNLCKLNT